eukprot:CAMPEP_0206598558 /NCGR_PEP_ID=MMETSP0325_2-20121206/44710_1 /ASSEMBLY_ACC=CAM_ASM_000347 /TAXON_ID=2866 /ORGANISM="Crypthecodinium cohnii, Strain Seligo" /LENGTH=117 /DNA_ID=CAMNT_0054109571 /DNA_START=405 /DNA_END=758 /DNA_ORIENTATION=+
MSCSLLAVHLQTFPLGRSSSLALLLHGVHLLLGGGGCSGNTLLNLQGHGLRQWGSFLFADMEGVRQARLQLVRIEGADASAHDEGKDGSQHRTAFKVVVGEEPVGGKDDDDDERSKL